MTEPVAPKPKKPRARSAGSADKPVTRSPRKSVRALTAERAAVRPALWTAAVVTLVTLLLDQLSKWFVVHHLQLDRVQEINVIDPFLNLRMAWNQGVNFGLFASEQNIIRWVLVAVAAVICIWVTVWLARARPGRWIQASAGLLIGGAIGNVIDRILYGAVADFLNMSLPSWRNPYSFNVADIAIFAGALGLVLFPAPRDDQNTRDGARKTR